MDLYSTPEVLPDGSLYVGSAGRSDPFGDPHHVAYLAPWPLPTHRSNERWRACFRLIRSLEEKLHRDRVPLVLYFVATWQGASVHHLVSEAGLEAPYAIVPAHWTVGEWLSDFPGGHGHPGANRVYAQLLYRLLARTLDWRPLPDRELDRGVAGVPIFEEPPPASQWRARYHSQLASAARQFLDETWDVANPVRGQWAGPGEPENGCFGRATTVLLRRREGSRELRVTVRRLAAVGRLYPLELTVSIPSPTGGSRVVASVPDDGPPQHSFTLAIPPDLDPGLALDVVFEAERVAADRRSLVARSLAIDRIEQLD